MSSFNITVLKIIYMPGHNLSIICALTMLVKLVMADNIVEMVGSGPGHPNFNKTNELKKME